ncbi:hypothetical protein H9L39_20368 [Fusarium oxysporum f. sp. albedinis]|nr:hypothetical protein H9L39_20368 [Fusarium oxysporum f. sp. albedinis]
MLLAQNTQFKEVRSIRPGPSLEAPAVGGSKSGVMVEEGLIKSIGGVGHWSEESCPITRWGKSIPIY